MSALARHIVGYADAEAQALLEGWRERLDGPVVPGRPSGDYRGRDRLGRLDLRRPMSDGALLGRALPGFLSLWGRVVPDEHVLVTEDRMGRPNRILLCPCGSATVLLPAVPTACSGVLWRDDDELDYDGCCRFFLLTGRDVRVKRFEAA
jgi:hypothetical protein